jgi:hypothetical protein
MVASVSCGLTKNRGTREGDLAVLVTFYIFVFVFVFA